MKEARFQYKCRRCGEIDASLCTAEKNAMPILINTVVGTKSNYNKGIPVNLLNTHICKDNGMGVCDLIGYEVVET